MVRSVVSPLRIAYDLLRVCPTFMNFFCSFVSIHALVAGFGGVSHDHFRRSLLLQHPTFFRLGRPVVLFFCGSEAWVATGICLGHHLHPVYPRLDLCSQPISATKGNRQVVRLPFSASASNSKAMICSLLLRISARMTVQCNRNVIMIFFFSNSFACEVFACFSMCCPHRIAGKTMFTASTCFASCPCLPNNYWPGSILVGNVL
jgi:hypothetical protein